MAYKFDNISVVLIDSQPAMVTLIRDVLKMFGIMRVHCFQDGARGLEYFLKNDADILIIDWDLESMNGIEFTKSIRSSSKNPYVPIIFMTALSSKNRVSVARDSGITEFLKKPFSAETLYKKIQSIIERPRPFVRSSEYFGPDRRGDRKDGYGGPDRRGNETDSDNT
jgi:DNA-binding response OmpR family regulator